VPNQEAVDTEDEAAIREYVAESVSRSLPGLGRVMRRQLRATDGEPIGPPAPPRVGGATRDAVVLGTRVALERALEVAEAKIVDPEVPATCPVAAYRAQLEAGIRTLDDLVRAYHAAKELRGRLLDRAAAWAASEAAREHLVRLARRQRVFSDMGESVVAAAQGHLACERILASRALVDCLALRVRTGRDQGLWNDLDTGAAFDPNNRFPPIEARRREDVAAAVNDVRRLLLDADGVLELYRESLGSSGGVGSLVHQVLAHFAMGEKPMFLERASLCFLCRLVNVVPHGSRGFVPRPALRRAAAQGPDAFYDGRAHTAAVIRDFYYHKARGDRLLVGTLFERAWLEFGMPYPGTLTQTSETLADAFVSWALPSPVLRFDFARLAQAFTFAWVMPTHARTAQLEVHRFLSLASRELTAFHDALREFRARGGASLGPGERQALLAELIERHRSEGHLYAPVFA